MDQNNGPISKWLAQTIERLSGIHFHDYVFSRHETIRNTRGHYDFSWGITMVTETRRNTVHKCRKCGEEIITESVVLERNCYVH